MMDSGAFTEVARHGGYRRGVEEYASLISHYSTSPALDCAVAQDWMCEPDVIARTGLDVAEHQRRTAERYDELARALRSVPVYIMPVIQGYAPREYAAHVAAYGDRLAFGAWVGVGSVCKRNAKPDAVAAVLRAVHSVRPDLRLHGFGVKLTALQSEEVRRRLYSADSMAWSYSARKQGRDANDWREAKAFERRVSEAV